MRTVTTEVYSFSELSDKAKQKAIAHYHDINVDYDWWDFIYEDASNVYIEITGFDVGRGQDIQLNFLQHAKDIADEIVKQHGEDCETYKTAKKFLQQWQVQAVTFALTEPCDDEQEDADEQLTEDFKKDIARCYWKTLSEDYSYRLSDEAVIESIEANDYEFTKDGRRYL